MNTAPDSMDRDSTLNIGGAVEMNDPDLMTEDGRLPEEYHLPPPHPSLRRQVSVQEHENVGYGGHPTPPPSPGRTTRVASPPRVSRSHIRHDTPGASERLFSLRGDCSPPTRYTPQRVAVPPIIPLSYAETRSLFPARPEQEHIEPGQLNYNDVDPLRVSTNQGPRTRENRTHVDHPPLISVS